MAILLKRRLHTVTDATRRRTVTAIDHALCDDSLERRDIRDEDRIKFEEMMTAVNDRVFDYLFRLAVERRLIRNKKLIRDYGPPADQRAIQYATKWVKVPYNGNELEWLTMHAGRVRMDLD